MAKTTAAATTPYELPERYLKHRDDGGWIGVDLDGTAAHYDDFVEIDQIGEPLWPMMDRIKQWCDAGMDVRIMTARYSDSDQRCIKSNRLITPEYMHQVIGDYFEKHIGYRLKPTCTKDYFMIELWDDRAVQMVPNTGRTLADEHLAELTALRGKGGI